ncbi:MAG: response regulator [Caldithrix sp.]|nr:response regulator [Caldithrix sp.]
MMANKKVLVVDDEPDAIEFVKAVLDEVDDFEIIPAYDGEEGIKKVAEHKPQLIILDVMLPGQDGFQVFYEIRKNESSKNIPIIMLTGVANKTGIQFFKKDMKEYMGQEPLEYIEKPLDPEKLQNAVKEAFA